MPQIYPSTWVTHPDAIPLPSVFGRSNYLKTIYSLRFHQHMGAVTSSAGKALL